MAAPRTDREPGRGTRRRALLISGSYALIAVLWIVGTDWLLTSLVPDPGTVRILEIAKGTFFVALTAILLYHLLGAAFTRTEDVANRLRLLAERSPDMIFRYRLGESPGFEYVSPSVNDLFGYSVEEYYADPDLPLKIVHPEDRHALRRQMENPESVAEREELRWVHRDGRTVWMEMKSTLVKDGRGRPVAVEGIVRDVTERREEERRRQILEAAVEAASDSVMITDVEGTIEYVNPAFSRMTGWNREDALGQNPRILRSGHQDEAFYRRMWKTLTAERTFQARFVNRRSDGSTYIQEARITPIVGASGIERYVSVARDMTEREVLERQLIEAQRTETIAQIIGGISHDFRNVLGIIRAQAGLALEERDDGPFPAGELREIARAAERGTDLVRKLLTLGKSEGLERRPVSLVEILQDLRPALRTVLPESIPIGIRLVEDDLLPFQADRGAIEQILVNLAANARDAVADGGHVTVELDRTRAIVPGPSDLVLGVRETPPKGWVRLRFQDDGVGMDTAVLQRIFEPFFTTKPRDRGTGLGMPMIARLVRLHGGAVTVSSAPGRGTTVSLFFPASPEETLSRPDAAPAEGELPLGRGQLVLVAEDEAPLLSAQVKVLERLGYDPVPARDGDEAVRILEERGDEIDLVMTDLIMPSRGGKEVYDEMGILGLRATPVIFMSGYAATDVTGGLPSGADLLFLEKPWTVEQLARKLSDALPGNP